MTPPRRNPTRERWLVHRAINRHGLTTPDRPRLLAEVADRLEKGQELDGDRWATTELDRLLTEIGEEGLDLICWSLLTLQRADHLDLGPAERDRLHRLLDCVICCGAVASTTIALARGDQVKGSPEPIGHHVEIGGRS